MRIALTEKLVYKIDDTLMIILCSEDDYHQHPGVQACEEQRITVRVPGAGQ